MLAKPRRRGEGAYGQVHGRPQSPARRPDKQQGPRATLHTGCPCCRPHKIWRVMPNKWIGTKLTEHMCLCLSAGLTDCQRFGLGPGAVRRKKGTKPNCCQSGHD